MQKIIIATRKSALALWQSEYIKDEIEKKHNIEVELLGMKTKGDIILDAPLAKIGGKGLFTKELQTSMLNGESHIAVHSLKDVPVEFPKGLVLAAITKREDKRDAFVSQKYSTLSALPKRAKVGTTSLRRRMQLLMLRDDLNIVSLRGNVNTRLKKLKEGEFDAIILAKAGIKRLGLEDEVRYVTPFSKLEMIPAMGQGALGIEAVDDKEIISLISFLNDKNTLIETTIERDFIESLNGGCQVPIGINAEVIGDKIEINAVVGMPDASKFIKEQRTISINECHKFGKKLADEFIQNGARGLLDEALKMGSELL